MQSDQLLCVRYIRELDFGYKLYSDTSCTYAILRRVEYKISTARLCDTFLR
jgi:hypothetical protein